MLTQNEDRPATVPKLAKQAGETRPRDWDWVERSVWTDRMLEALEKGVKGGVWFSLVDKVHRPGTLRAAWEKVRVKQGAAGSDGQTIAMFEERLERNLGKLEEELRSGTYQPRPIRRVYIDKPGSAEKRPLGIPAVRDRVVQSALRILIEPIFEAVFTRNNYGFRPGRGCKDALREVERLLSEGYVFVLDADLRSYFESIPHEPLLGEVRKHIADGRVLGLIEQYLKQDIRSRTKRCNGQSMEQIILDLNEVLWGWYGYFKHSNKWTFPRLDAWIRMRLRSILRKRNRMCGKGRGSDHQRWPNKYFRDRGLFSLAEAHASYLQSS